MVGPNTCTRSFSVSATKMRPPGATATPAGRANAPASVPVEMSSASQSADGPAETKRTAPESMSAAATYPPPAAATPLLLSAASRARAAPEAPTSAVPPRSSATTARPCASTATPDGAENPAARPPAIVRRWPPAPSRTWTRPLPVSATQMVPPGPAATPPGESNCPGEPIVVTFHRTAPPAPSVSLIANTAPAPASETSMRPPAPCAMPDGRTNPAAPDGSMSAPSCTPSRSPSDRTRTLPPPPSATMYLAPSPPPPSRTAPTGSMPPTACCTSAHAPTGTPTTPMWPVPYATTASPPPCTADTPRGSDAPAHRAPPPCSKRADPRAITRWSTVSATRTRPSGATARPVRTSGVPILVEDTLRSAASYTLTESEPESLSSTLPSRSIAIDGVVAGLILPASSCAPSLNTLIHIPLSLASTTATLPSGPAATSHGRVKPPGPTSRLYAPLPSNTRTRPPWPLVSATTMSPLRSAATPVITLNRPPPGPEGPNETACV